MTVALQQLMDVVLRIERRLELVENKVEALSAPPEAYKLSTAAKLLDVSIPTLVEDMKIKGILPVPMGKGRRPYVRREDLVRMTLVRPSSTPPPAPRIKRKAKTYDPRVESVKLAEALKKR